MAKTLLVIDQNLAVHRLLDFTLSKEGFEIVAVEDGLAALDRAYQHAPDLIMVNSQLDGLPLSMFVRKVREQEALRAVPIILMAQSSDELNMEQLRRSGITDVVKKPLDAMEINSTINRCIAPAAPAAVAAKDAASAAGSNGAAVSPPQSRGAEEDQNMAEMEQLLGWVPREQAGPSVNAGAPPSPPAAAAPQPPQAPPVTEQQAAAKPFEFDLYDPTAQPGSTSQTNAATASMEDLLITPSEAIMYQQPVAEPPPASQPVQEPELASSAEPEDFLSKQAPFAVEEPERAAPPPPLQSTSPASGGLEEMTRDETEQLVRAMVEEMTRKVTQETVERITRDLVPELAERAVRAEIDRLKAESSTA
ncbi:MAG TPA: response regulator [Nitrospiria bacterium]|nr:response regulator [Nitrospiria bacterium]